MPRLRDVTSDEWRLVARAASHLLRVRLALWFLPFNSVRLNSAARAGAEAGDRYFADRAAWAVSALGRRLPMMTCLVQAIALQTLLAEHGDIAILRIGVRREVSDGSAPRLLAHAWLERDGRVLIGHMPDLASYAALSAPADHAAARLVWEG